MSGLATTDHNSCAALPFHGKTGSFPSITHTSTPLPWVFLRWLNCPPHSLFSYSLCSSVIVPKPQSNDLSNRRNGSSLANWSSLFSVLIFQSAPAQRLTVPNGMCHFCSAIRLTFLSCAVYWPNTEVASGSRLSNITHTKLRKPGGTVWSWEEKDKDLWCTAAEKLLDRCHHSPWYVPLLWSQVTACSCCACRARSLLGVIQNTDVKA